MSNNLRASKNTGAFVPCRSRDDGGSAAVFWKVGK
jgi:hypothetical protein